MPMEIDRLQQKGKGKGKGLKGKGKIKGEKGKSKGKAATSPKGGQKDRKGKGGKDQKLGRGKGSGGDVCWTCGKMGYHSKDCWRVRQVEAPPAASVSSQQTTSLSTTSTSATGVTEARLNSSCGGAERCYERG